MSYGRSRHGFRAMFLGWTGARSTLESTAVGFVLAGAVSATASAQQLAIAATSLVFDGVTVVDVEQGKLLPAQRVVITGNRIQAVGDLKAVSVPKGAQVVDARDKYLIPGLWDMHAHLAGGFRAGVASLPSQYQLLLANGVTGLRDAGSWLVPLDTLVQWRRGILAGTRIGPPRQLFSGIAIRGPYADGEDRGESPLWWVADSGAARHLVDSAKAAGVDLIKIYGMSRKMYLAVAAEARRVGLPFGGHLSMPGLNTTSATDASESGASIIDHTNSSGGLDTLCFVTDGIKNGIKSEFPPYRGGASVERCRPIAERLRRTGTWVVPTVSVTELFSHRDWGFGQPKPPVPHSISWLMSQLADKFFSNSVFLRTWLRDPARVPVSPPLADLRIAEQAGLPLLAGSDLTIAISDDTSELSLALRMLSGYSLHGELALMAEYGLTPLAALQAATLNPAKWLHATDSLGTVAPGKLADLVLLDANPLADITNTTAIRAVVANGRYFDRVALDQLLAEVRANAKGQP